MMDLGDRKPPKGMVLGIDTSTRLGSVALAIDGAVMVSEYLTEPKAHASGVFEAIESVLSFVKGGVGDLVGVAVGAGPGSFTGLRVSGATAIGLAGTLNVPVYSASSLRAGCLGSELLPVTQAPGVIIPPRDLGKAVSWNAPPKLRYVLADARRGRVYGACYRMEPLGPVEVIAPHGGTIDDVFRTPPDRGTVFMGEGAQVHRDLIVGAGFEFHPYPSGQPCADAVIEVCRWEPTPADEWEPAYVREWRPG